MYDYEYEDDVLGTLRLLKFAHDTEPTVFQHALQFYGTLASDDLYDMAEFLVTEMFANDYIPELDPDDDMGQIFFSDPLMDDFIELGIQLADKMCCGSRNAQWEKLDDAIAFFLGSTSYSIFDFQLHHSGVGITLQIVLSPDSYEAILFGNSMIDLLLYLKEEVQRMKAILTPKGKVIEITSEIREEAA